MSLKSITGRFRIPDRFEPVKDGSRIAVGIARAAVGPETLAGHDVFEAVAVHVDEINGMGLRENHAVLVRLRSFFSRLLVQDDMFFESNLTVLADLLEPSQAVAVRSETCDHVVFAVAIHVVGEHVRAATF